MSGNFQGGDVWRPAILLCSAFRCFVGFGLVRPNEPVELGSLGHNLLGYVWDYDGQDEFEQKHPVLHEQERPHVRRAVVAHIHVLQLVFVRSLLQVARSVQHARQNSADESHQ